MSIINTINDWAERRVERRDERWAAREESLSSQLPAWRTDSRVRLLIRIYLGSLAAGLLTAIAQIFWTPFLFAWVPFTVIVCTSWTMLRTVINTRDVAPDAELDEYEAKIIRTWQVAGYGWMTMIILAVSLFMVLVAVFNPDNLGRWVYTGGLFSILGMMTATALPTVAYATTFGPVPPSNN
ncbi:hypothetical protein PQI66_15040 [Corynebacterium sp. USCH3]|uniref:hypothetical protein n=1 Tax=Corynebacterium sp. USCH3 TaxID=3024840 RepID=UPI0030B46FAE